MTDPLLEDIKAEEAKKININTEEVKRFVANFMIPLVSLLLIIVMFLFIIRPALTNKPVLEQELASKEQLTAILADKYSKLTNLLDFRESVDENAALLDKALVSEPLVPQLLTQIDQIAKESGLVVTRLSYSIAESSAPGQQDVSVTIDKDVIATLGVDGTYGQMVTFLDAIENAGRIVLVDNLRFTASEEDTNVYSASFTVSSPYVELNTQAVTDDPITFDITDPEFQALMDKLKQLRIYNISIDEVLDISNLEESVEELPIEDTSAPVEQPAEQLP